MKYCYNEEKIHSRSRHDKNFITRLKSYMHYFFVSIFTDIRLQLNEQLRCLDIRVESQISLIQELQEFYR